MKSQYTDTMMMIDSNDRVPSLLEKMEYWIDRTHIQYINSFAVLSESCQKERSSLTHLASWKLDPE